MAHTKITGGHARVHARCDMEATLASGQTFAFVPCTGGFSGIVDRRPVMIHRESDGDAGCGAGGITEGVARSAEGFAAGGTTSGGYIIECPEADAAFWRRYFDLDRHYGELLSKYILGGNMHVAGSGDMSTSAPGEHFLAMCVEAFNGLKLLRQPVWETICAFIISANNHQKRIESIYRGLSRLYGEAIEWAGMNFYAFPSAQALAAAGEDGLRQVGLGYRAPYLWDTAKSVAMSGLADIDNLAYENALKYLMSFRGVGEKVADCVLLFSTRHQKAFPVDVWIERALREHYGMGGSRREMKLMAQAMFGDAAGVAQQFLFHGMRTKLTRNK
ncbi:MAG: hypothetical protein FWH01_05910 [Oscillospiraceae bacterium]|nr:hypothetical protein [Oscillospiraceae bacterium]